MSVIEKIESFLKDYVSFEDESIALVIAVWSVATHIFESFDAFPYIVITSATKRSGKTRLSELISDISCNTKNFSAMTPSTLFRVIDRQDIGAWDKDKEENKTPTVVFDEAETLSSDSASTMRAVLNVGYRKGQKIPRTVGNRVIEFNTYCPKVFILIGDVYDTLRDRSIVINMKRGEPRKRFAFDVAKNEANVIRKEFLPLIGGKDSQVLISIIEHYHSDHVNFLQDRDEEIWRSILAVGKVLCPARYRELQRIAVDLAAGKTAEKRRYTNLTLFEDQAENDEYAKRLLRDLLTVINGDKNITSDVAIERLKALDLAPWRKYRGDGLTMIKMADMLSRFGVSPGSIRQGSKVGKGYKKKDVEEAVRDL
jgi:hypothetical protein